MEPPVREPVPVPVVFPERTWTLSTLSEEQYCFWERNGYLVVPDVISKDLCRRTANAIYSFVQANREEPETWYRNTLDIYSDLLPNGKRPHHGPCGMVQMSHHETLWALRQDPSVYGIFKDLYGTDALYVTTDRAHFKAPEDSRFPAWSDPGEVHKNLHWDIETKEEHWPVPFAIQGIVYLEDTPAELGSLRVVPGFHRRLGEWSKSFGSRSGRECPPELDREAIHLAGSTGSLVLWLSVLPHGPSRNVGSVPRVSAYVAMLPVEADKFNGGHPEMALSMADAGTLAYDEGPVKRLKREDRVARWKERKPLLDEDPDERDLPHAPPDEAHGRPAELTELGEKLVGLVSW